MSMKTSKIAHKSYISIQKEWFDMVNGGVLTLSDFLVLLWLRDIANIKGVALVQSYAWLGSILPSGNTLKTHAIAKILKKLQKLKLIDYSNTQGSRSGFRITLSHWPIGCNMARVFIDESEDAPVTTGEQTKMISHSQVELNVESIKHKSVVDTDVVKHGHKPSSIKDLITSRQIEKGIKSEKNNDRHSNKTTKVSTYVPSSEIDDRLHRIAKSVDEEYMGFVFWVYGEKKDEGISVMDKVAANLIDYPGPVSKPRLFNSEVCRRLQLGKYDA
ncbi:MAG: hypothetical protein ACI9H6_000119 [Patiriisocius sp.]|jgi:hypothetical protein